MIGIRKQHGFTIVELLIVVVIVAILASITIVAYTGIQQRSKNSAVAATVTSYVKALMLSATDKSSYPAAPAAGCLDGSTTCWSGASTSTTANLVNALTPIMGTLPPLPQSAYNYFASYGGYYIVFTLADASSCPSIGGTIPQASSIDTNGNRQCRVSLPAAS